MKSAPLATLLLGATAILAYLLPSLGSWLQFERDALLGGQLWRLATASLVHFSISHLLLNLAGFLVVAGYVELRVGRSALAGWILALALPSAALPLVTRPDMAYYGGLSALIFGLATVVCARELLRTRRAVAWWLALAALSLLAILPALTAGPLVPLQRLGEVRVIWESHLAAVLVAITGVLVRARGARTPGARSTECARM